MMRLNDYARNIVRENGWTASEFAMRLGVPYSRAWRFLHGEYRLTPDLAWRLEIVTGVSIEKWYELQKKDWIEEIERLRNEQNND